MATDQSPTRNRLILTIAIGTLFTLVGLKFVFDSYFTDMMESEALAKIATPDEVRQLREDEHKKLTGSPLPIERAMRELAQKGRDGSPLIAPQQSTDDAPLVGWAKGERAMQAASAPAAATADAGAATNEAAGDGGTALAAVGDGGATATATAARDAGAASSDAGGAAPHANGGHP